MKISRTLSNSSDLEGIFDIPESMKNKKVKVTLSTCEDDDSITSEIDTWDYSVIDKHEES